MAIRNDGKLTTKVQEIENYKSGVTKYESIEIREATMRIHGNTAIYNSAKFDKGYDQREAIQWRRSQHSGLGKTERQLENCRISGDTRSSDERVSPEIPAGTHCHATLLQKWFPCSSGLLCCDLLRCR